MISECISKDKPPQMNILNMVITSVPVYHLKWECFMPHKATFYTINMSFNTIHKKEILAKIPKFPVII